MLDQILQFLKEHQMLSGSIGVILVAIIGLFAKNNLKSTKQTQKIGNNSTGYQAGGSININNSKDDVS